MATSLRVEIENATGAGLKAIERDLGSVAGEAQSLGKEMLNAGWDSSNALSDLRTEASSARQALGDVAKASIALGDTDDSIIDVMQACKDLRFQLEGVEDASGDVAKALHALDESDAALSDLRSQFKALQNELSQVRGEALNAGSAVDRSLGDTSGPRKLVSAIDDVNDELAETARDAKKAEAAVKGIGGKGGGVGGLSLQFTGLNQALELGKKAVEGVAVAVTHLADAGNPAAQSLIDSFSQLGSELIKIGDDPVITNTMKSWEGTIKGTVIPAIGQIPGALRWVQDGFAGVITTAGEFTGFFPEGTTEALKEEQQHLAEISEEQRAINEEARKTAMIFGRVTDIEKKLADEFELGNIAQSKSQRGLLDLLDLEIESRQELADAGELSGKKLEASDKRVETIKRRLITLSKEEADAAIKAQTDIADARQKAADEYTQILADAKAVAEEDANTKSEAIKADAKKAMDELKAAIGQAKSLLNPQDNLVDSLRGQFGGKDVQGQLVKQAKEDARQKYISENRGKVDLEGKASGDTTAQRQANQRKADAAIAKAEREAVIKTTKQIRSGSVTGEDQLQARDTLLMNRADKARDAGILKPEQYKAFKGQLDDSRNAFGEQQKQARDNFGLQSLRGNGPTKEQWENMQVRRGNAAGGATQGSQDAAMSDVLGTVARGSDNYGRFAQTATQGFGQLSTQFQQQAVQINSLQQQFAAMIAGNQAASERTRAQRAR